MPAAPAASWRLGDRAARRRRGGACATPRHRRPDRPRRARRRVAPARGQARGGLARLARRPSLLDARTPRRGRSPSSPIRTSTRPCSATTPSRDSRAPRSPGAGRGRRARRARRSRRARAAASRARRSRERPALRLAPASRTARWRPSSAPSPPAPRSAPEALLALGKRQLARGERAAAAAAFDRSTASIPLAPEAQAGARTPARARATRCRPHRRPSGRASCSSAARRSSRRAAPAKRSTCCARVRSPACRAAEADLARVRLARALVARGRAQRGPRAAARRSRPAPPHAAEAAFRLAADRRAARGRPRPSCRSPTASAATPWGEEALLVARQPLPEGRARRRAAPWWRRLLAEYPGRPLRRARRLALAAGATTAPAATRRRPRPSRATARRRPPSGHRRVSSTGPAARARLGQDERARELFDETVQRYKHAYHGLARGTRSPASAAPAPRAARRGADAAAPEPPLPEPRASRARQLLLIDRLDEAARELRLLPRRPARPGDARLDRLAPRAACRPAIIAMKRAYPEWVGEAGDGLPREVWQVLFPLRYEPGAASRRPRGGARPRARRRSHPAGVDLRRRAR